MIPSFLFAFSPIGSAWKGSRQCRRSGRINGGGSTDSRGGGHGDESHGLQSSCKQPSLLSRRLRPCARDLLIFKGNMARLERFELPTRCLEGPLEAIRINDFSRLQWQSRVKQGQSGPINAPKTRQSLCPWLIATPCWRHNRTREAGRPRGVPLQRITIPF